MTRGDGWTDRAACRARLEAGLPDLHGAAGKQVNDARAARQICLGCPVLNICIDWSSSFVWNGVTVGGWTAPQDWSGSRHPGIETVLGQAYKDRRQARRSVA